MHTGALASSWQRIATIFRTSKETSTYLQSLPSDGCRRAATGLLQRRSAQAREGGTAIAFHQRPAGSGCEHAGSHSSRGHDKSISFVASELTHLYTWDLVPSVASKLVCLQIDLLSSPPAVRLRSHKQRALCCKPQASARQRARARTII